LSISNLAPTIDTADYSTDTQQRGGRGVESTGAERESQPPSPDSGPLPAVDLQFSEGDPWVNDSSADALFELPSQQKVDPVELGVEDPAWGDWDRLCPKVNSSDAAVEIQEADLDELRQL